MSDIRGASNSQSPRESAMIADLIEHPTEEVEDNG